MKVVVITGATSGFGMQLLYDLDEYESIRFFVLARNRAKFEEMIRRKPLRNEVSMVECDLLSLNAIENATREIKLAVDCVDVLINNAGLWSDPEFRESIDGTESTLAVNHIAPFVITGKLLSLLSNSRDPRIVNTASFKHKEAKVIAADIELRGAFDAELAYCNSKLYNILFTKALARKCADSGINVNCFDPGIVDTPMLKQALPPRLSFFYPLIRQFVARTPKKGAETGLYLALSENVSEQTGQYFRDKKVVLASEQTNDHALQEWLWDASVELAGFEYGEFS